MKKIIVKQAERSQMEWINSKYDEVMFVKSNFENEYIVIAKVENENAGLGRLVKIDNENLELGGIYVFPDFRGLGIAEKIVRNLCDKNPFEKLTIWCLPFENLLSFYSKFGFKNYKEKNTPEKVAIKLNWCNSNNKYTKKVILLTKINNVAY
jgi:N-acetylglutamate synthase-like GNAT family acetyltransferase